MRFEKYVKRISDKYNSREYDLARLKKDAKVRFWCDLNDEPKLLEGIIKVIDYDGGGLCFNVTPSVDVLCEGVLYKHISIVDVEFLE